MQTLTSGIFQEMMPERWAFALTSHGAFSLCSLSALMTSTRTKLIHRLRLEFVKSRDGLSH